MIVRDISAQLLCITHAERGRLAKSLARQVGNNQFETLSPSLILACASLDRGLIETSAEVIDVTKLDRAALLDYWERSGRQTAEIDPYAGLLVTLHGFWNSISAGTWQQPQWQADPVRVRFDLNRFQHSIIELLESLRQQCGLRIDRPLKFGLSENMRDPRERRLRSDFEWLELIARLSESLCRGMLPSQELIARQRGSAKPVAFTLKLAEPRTLLHPWPFNRARIDLAVAAAVVDRASAAEREVVATPPQTFAIELGPLTI